ncbi:hypothetical protein ACFSGX_00250 [Sphingomonas arantia]|uniref:UrcA family protein n=1 Tax=Sphingomonas arantia TaxID=1460676 RepID=A0ABW4TUE6_9SPHN
MKSTIAIALLLLSTTATAQTSSTQARYDAAASKARTGSDPERVICRTAVETGSLVKRTRRCMTSAQWSRSRDGENAAARNMVQQNAGLANGN